MIAHDDPACRPYRETLARTIVRTFAIAFGVTTLLALVLPRDRSFLAMWLITYPAVLWFPLGGHYVELLYLNVLCMKYPWARKHRVITRVLVWMAGGLPLGVGCRMTWIALGYERAAILPWWWGVLFFPMVECIVHTVMSLRGKPSFWNGRPEIGNLNSA